LRGCYTQLRCLFVRADGLRFAKICQSAKKSVLEDIDQLEQKMSPDKSLNLRVIAQ
jgi:hypothetical protein